VEIGTAAARVLGGVLRSERKHYISLIAAGSGAGVYLSHAVPLMDSDPICWSTFSSDECCTTQRHRWAVVRLEVHMKRRSRQYDLADRPHCDALLRLTKSQGNRLIPCYSFRPAGARPQHLMPACQTRESAALGTTSSQED